jgi:type IV secretory pathway VirB4 component
VLEHDWATALERVASKETDSAELAGAIIKQLRYWLEGAYGHAFCRNRTTDAKETPGQTLSLWNLESITDADTQGVVMGVLSGVIARSIQEAPTVVVLDEVWSIFKSEAGAALVETLYRTVRKEGSAIWTISQSMNDYVALPDATRSAILNNSPIKLFLSHDPSELELVTRLFQRTLSTDGPPRASRPTRLDDVLMAAGGRRW